MLNQIKLLKAKLYTTYYKLYNLYNLKRQNIIIADDWQIKGIVFFSNRSLLKIGRGFCANSGKNLNPIGGDTIARLICLKDAELTIGNNVRMSNSTILAQSRIIIEDNVTIGGNCKIWDTDFHSLDPKRRGTNNDIPINKPILIKKTHF